MYASRVFFHFCIVIYCTICCLLSSCYKHECKSGISHCKNNTKVIYFFHTVTEYEIDRGMQNAGDRRTSLGFIRIIEDISDHMDDSKACLYTDIVSCT